MFVCDIVKSGRTTRADRILIAFVLGASALLAAYFLVSGRHSGRAYAVIEQDGKEIMRLSLMQERTVRIDWEDGYNVIRVSGQSVWVSEADCPDQICVGQGMISKGQESIVCLPHRLLVRLEGLQGGTDAMTKGEEFEKDSGFEYAHRGCPDAFLCGSADSGDSHSPRH